MSTDRHIPDLFDGANVRRFDLDGDGRDAVVDAVLLARWLRDHTAQSTMGPRHTNVEASLRAMWNACKSNDLLPKVEAAMQVVLACNQVAAAESKTVIQKELLDYLRRWESKYPAASEAVALTFVRRARAVEQGKEGAYVFQSEINNLLMYLFDPALRDPKAEHPLNERLKRVDLVFTNEATSGFFWWVQKTVHCPFVYVEIKNYSEGNDPKNPEFDQLSGRLNPARGLLGIMVCREIEEREMALRRAREYQRKGEYVLALDLDDLQAMAIAHRAGDERVRFPLLFDRFRELVE